MPIDIAEYQRLKEAAERAKAAADREAGKAEAAEAVLRERYGATTLEEADALQKILDKEAAEAERTYEAEKARFEAEWKSYLDGAV